MYKFLKSKNFRSKNKPTIVINVELGAFPNTLSI